MGKAKKHSTRGRWLPTVVDKQSVPLALSPEMRQLILRFTDAEKEKPFDRAAFARRFPT